MSTAATHLTEALATLDNSRNFFLRQLGGPIALLLARSLEADTSDETVQNAIALALDELDSDTALLREFATHNSIVAMATLVRAQDPLVDDQLLNVEPHIERVSTSALITARTRATANKALTAAQNAALDAQIAEFIAHMVEIGAGNGSASVTPDAPDDDDGQPPSDTVGTGDNEPSVSGAQALLNTLKNSPIAVAALVGGALVAVVATGVALKLRADAQREDDLLSHELNEAYTHRNDYTTGRYSPEYEEVYVDY